MNIGKKIISKSYLLIFLLLVTIFIIYLAIDKFKGNKEVSLEPIKINLLATTHKKLHWKFKPIDSVVFVKPGEVTTIEYIVENMSNNEATGIATFAYYPSEFGNYINKLNCFCYDAKTLKSKGTDKYSLVLFIDPEVTKDSKTKSIKEITMQFIFFDYKEYKKIKS